MRGSTAGWHLLFDAFVADSNSISDAPRIQEIFKGLVKVLMMDILVPPQIIDVPLDEGKLSSDSDDGGLTGFCVITTSHISIHTWPLRKRFSMDVYSCKPFDEEAALAYLRDAFGVVKDKHGWISRDWPED